MGDVETGRFVFATCQVGAEASLKRELGRAHPALRPAFARPGFVTFKLDATRPPLGPDFVPRSVFARSWGLSLGAWGRRGGTVDERARELLQALRFGAPPGDARVLLHLWERDRWPAGAVPPGADLGAWAARVREAIRQHASGLPELRLDLDTAARPGQLVHDLIVVDADTWWRGLHQHTPGHSPYPGGQPPLELPADAPSRAYLKLEEGVAWAGLELRAGDVAVEVGSAPGGAAWALLQRGLQVVGIDPGAMHPRVLAHPRFTHLACGVDALRWEDLPLPVHWLLLDVNVQPRHALRALRHLLPGLRGGLLGVLLTLKLNRWSLAEQVPAILRQLRAQGLAWAAARQLASNHQELFACGLTTAGLARTPSGPAGRAP